MTATTLKTLGISALLASTLVLSACGTRPGERALSGAAIGAAGGAAVGALAGSPGTGAAIGALGGAAIGAATDPCDVNLDRDSEEYRRRCGR